MNTASLFDSALAGLHSAQAGMMVTSQNVAGASVDGYVRRSPLIRNIAMSSSTADPAGSTFAVEGFTRNFNALLQGQIYSQTAASAYTKTLISTVSTLDSILVDPTTSIASAMGSFFNSVGALANEPDNYAYQMTLLGNASLLVDRIQGVDGVLSNIETNAKQGMADVLNESNALASELANVNAKIRGAGVPGVGYPTADLLDERDRLLSRLSELLGGHAIIDGDGTGSFEISGTFLVNREIASQFTNASGSVPITADQDFSGIKIKMAGKLVSTQIETLTTVNQIEVPDERFAARSIFTSGKAGAFAHLVNDFVPTMNRVLSVASAMLVHHVNSYSSDAAASHDPQKAIFGFLDANGETTFPSLGKVNTDPDDLAALLEDGNGNWLSFDQILENIASGDATTWQALRELGDQIDASRLVSIGKYTDDKFSLLTSALSAPIGRTSDGSVSGTRSNFLEAERAFFSAPITYITSSAATTFATWRSNDTANQTLMSSLNAQKESTSGVNLDEEAANLVKYQQLYNASSKVIQTSKQMFDTLLAMMSGN